ncbi:hypothetical protein ALC56_09680 [Trachymyrmex septentrionalis]|uniref:Uncharacterized protein n=1 Tax=Trachymyrmex septentrionalis TaxID=34720 RepID=A0A195F743_9HYME|nr:PREDICTED: uncharacterized protein LOC108751428 [Trachymyrmex septentrionalis]KYN35889.1 hypothetical protein ALC56_09680 [Trachymyrmex septentrionalis]
MYKSAPPREHEHQSIFDLRALRGFPDLQQSANMKYFTAIALFALVAIAALTEAKPTAGVESIEPARAESTSPEAARNKRGLLLSAAYTAPLTYSAAYTAPAVAYSAYSYPYAYAAYSSYPYYAAGYSAPYYLA